MKSRKMKFRAFDTLTKSLWVGHSVSIDANGNVSFLDTDGIWKQDENNRIVISQFTGQKDKNGKEIYEGDILKESAMSIYEIQWGNRYCKFYLNWENVSPSIQYPEWNRGVQMEIIGNIYENPELLKP